MKSHTHKCERCTTPFRCDGELLQNPDGWPDVICTHYHEGGAQHHEWRQCEECALTAWCESCGRYPAVTEHEGDRICLTCADEAREQPRKATA